ncbi:MAG: hypothetical protein JXR94_00590 [Candidatus Hydrogenedentes bacterium]|nr:hypothetical protein [Candidatus Hydrogenedentota bacterium]
MDAQITLNMLGCGVRVEADDTEPIACVRERLGAFESSHRAGEAHCVHVRRAGARWAVEFEGRTAALSLTQGWPALDDLLKLIVVRERSDLRFVHASAVACHGNAALFIGPSTSGKTTLAVALARAGFQLLADDTTPIHLDTAAVWPFRTGMTLRPFTEALVRDMPEQDEGGQPASARWLFILERDEARPARRVAMDGRLQEWERMYELCTGRAAGRNSRRSQSLLLQGEQHFARAPELRPCPASVALRVLGTHMHPPHPPLKELLPATARFFEGLRRFSLKPGRLDETVGCVLGVIEGEKT